MNKKLLPVQNKRKNLSYQERKLFGKQVQQLQKIQNTALNGDCVQQRCILLIWQSKPIYLYFIFYLLSIYILAIFLYFIYFYFLFIMYIYIFLRVNVKYRSEKGHRYIPTLFYSSYYSLLRLLIFILLDLTKLNHLRYLFNFQFQFLYYF